jgi:hypothetical protein
MICSTRLAIGTIVPDYQLDVQAVQASFRVLSSGNSDAQFISTSSGKTGYMKKTPGGIFYILSSSDATAADLQIYTSSTQRSLTLNAAGDAVFDGSISSKNPSKLTYTTLPTFTTTQVGYTLVGTSNSTANLTATMVTYATLTLNAGVYIITGILATGYSGSLSGVGVYVYQATTQLPGGFSYGITSSVAYASQQLTCIVSNSTASQSYTLKANCTSAATYVNCFFQAVRIA